jgi:hypothetical protein
MMAPSRRKPTSHRNTRKLGSFRGKLQEESGKKRDAPDDDNDEEYNQPEGSNKRSCIVSAFSTQDDDMRREETGGFDDLGDDGASVGSDGLVGGLVSLLDLASSTCNTSK